MNTQAQTSLNERILGDDYPVHPGYLYVADGRVVSSNISGTVRNLKRDLKASVITNCDISGRNLW